MRRRWMMVGVVLAVVVAAPAVWVLALQGGGDVELAAAEIFIEINDTDGDAGIQIFMDGEGWNKMTVTDPNGTEHLVLEATSGIGAQGLTEFFFESAEPSFDVQPLSELLDRFPEGKYTYTGETVDGDVISGAAELTHDIPAAPVVSPADGAEVEGPVVIGWEEVTEPAGIEIVRYQVIVELEEPLQVFQIDMPPDARSVTVPAEWIEPGTDYVFEVLAKEASGNQIITEHEFSTAE